MNHYVALLYISELTGTLMIIGGLAMIWKQKVDINRVTKNIEITVPFFGKLRSNTPALALFVIGFFPIFYPLQKLKTEYLHVQQDVDSDVRQLVIYAVVETKTIEGGNGSFDLPIPVLADENYSPQIVYRAGIDTVTEVVNLKQMTNGVIKLRDRKILGRDIDVIPDVTAPPERFK